MGAPETTEPRDAPPSSSSSTDQSVSVPAVRRPQSSAPDDDEPKTTDRPSHDQAAAAGTGIETQARVQRRLGQEARDPSRPYDSQQQQQPAAAAMTNQPARRAPHGEPLPPGFDDEHEIGAPPRTRPPPLGIGHDDLHPPGLGPHDPLRRSGGGAGPFGGGGMHPTFDDPLFAGGRHGDGRGGRGGQDEFDFQVPPGARYDPVGPGAVPRFPGGRGSYRGQGGGPFGGGPFGGGGGGDGGGGGPYGGGGII